MGKFGSRHKLCIIWNSIFFLFRGHAKCALWVNLEVPINCVLLEHWNSIFSLFGGYSMRAPHKLCNIRTLEWVNLEVPINCVLSKHWNSIFFLF